MQKARGTHPKLSGEHTVKLKSLVRGLAAAGESHKLLFRPAMLAAALFGLAQSAAAAGLPPSQEFRLAELPLAKSLLVPEPDMEKISFEDAKSVGGAFRYGVQVEQNLDLHTGGTWTTLRDGRMVWRARVASPGARTLDFAFSEFKMSHGSALYIVSADQKTVHGPYNADNNPADGQFYSPYVEGETATLELIVPRHEVRDVQLKLKSVTHGYRGLIEGTMAKSGSCNVDVVCPTTSGWDNQIDAVGHYTFSQGGSSYVCSGTLIANSNRDSVPYFLTANHCVSTQTVASTIVVYWNYQSATCRAPGSSASGTPVAKSVSTHNQSGTTLVATNAASDFALLRLNANVPAGADAYFAGWDRSGATPGSAVGIHHPAGDEKRYSRENQALSISSYSGNAGSGTTHLRIADWDEGTTEGGSSGSGLFDGSSKRLIGQLHGGGAACGNNEPDWYGRLATSWTGGGSNATRLSNWLDPGNSGVTVLDGHRNGGTTTPPPTSTPLTNGVAVTGQGASTGGELRYTLVVPAGASNLRFVSSGGSGDADLYVRFGSAPTTASFDCKSEGNTNAETCTIATAQAGTYHVLLRAYATFSGASLTGSYTTGVAGGTSFFENQADYTISDNSTVESPITVSGRSGNAPSNLQVAVTILHTYQGDLKVDLVAPDGTLYNLHNRSGGGTDNVIKTVTVNASSEVANGVWKLRVNDNAGGDVGRIDKWSLQF